MTSIITDSFVKLNCHKYFFPQDSCFFMNYYQSRDYWRGAERGFDVLKTSNVTYQYFHHFYLVDYYFTLVSFDRQPHSLYFYGMNDLRFFRRYFGEHYEMIFDSTLNQSVARTIDLSQEENIVARGRHFHQPFRQLNGRQVCKPPGRKGQSRCTASTTYGLWNPALWTPLPCRSR